MPRPVGQAEGDPGPVPRAILCDAGGWGGDSGSPRRCFWGLYLCMGGRHDTLLGQESLQVEIRHQGLKGSGSSSLGVWWPGQLSKGAQAGSDPFWDKGCPSTHVLYQQPRTQGTRNPVAPACLGCSTESPPFQEPLNLVILLEGRHQSSEEATLLEGGGVLGMRPSKRESTQQHHARLASKLPGPC